MSFVNTLVQGVLLGGLYALYAAGLSLIFGVMRLVNLAHGDLIVLGAFFLLSISSALFVPVPVALLIILPFMFAFGWALQRFILNRTVDEDLLVPLLVTFGLSIIIQQGLLQAYSANSRRLFLGPIESQSINFLGINIGVMPLVTFVLAIVVIGALSFLFYKTKLGRMLRATSDSTRFVQIMGVNPHTIFAIAMGISFVVIAIAAFSMGTRTTFDPASGPSRLLYAFEAVVIGGLGSLWGTLVGGIIIGIAYLVGGSISPTWQQLAPHIVFLIVILVRPRGLFPKS